MGGLVIIGVSVVLPVIIVWLIVRTIQNKTNRQADVLIRSMENGQSLDQESLQKLVNQRKPLKLKLLNRLTTACIMSLLGLVFFVLGLLDGGRSGWDNFDFGDLYAGGILLAIGIAFFIAYFVGKRMLAPEIEAEERERGYRK